MAHRHSSIVVRHACTVLVALCLLPLHGGEPKADYAADLSAFFAKMDSAYPFFDLKGIRKDWALLKDRLLKKAKTCKSDPDFLAIVCEAIDGLRDGHMGIVKCRVPPTPREPEWYPGISFLAATKNRVLVLSAPEKFAQVLVPGTIVTKIDGKDARTVLEAKAKEAWARGGSFSSPQRARLFEYRIPLRGKKGERHRIAFLDGKKSKEVALLSDVETRGWPHGYNPPENLTAQGRSCRYGKLPGGAGYISLRNIDNEVEPGIAAALAAHPDAKGWIIDIRGNGGGGYGDELQKRIAAIPRPVACIIDAGCVSAGETFARDLVQSVNARLIGETTAGASSAKEHWDFPSGIATLTIPTRSRFGPDRRPIEFFGIKPHEDVECVPEEVRSGKNSEILRAEEYLAKAAGKS